MKKKLEYILIIFDIIVLIYAAVVIYRMCILYGLEKKGLQYVGKTNCKIEQESDNQGYISKRYAIFNNNKSFSKSITYDINNDNNRVIIDYNNNGECYTLIETSNVKCYTHDTVENIEYEFNGQNINLNFQEKLAIAVLGNIHESKCDFKDSYYIKLFEPNTFGQEVIVDKETGLVVEESQIQENLNVNPNTGAYEKETYTDIQKFKYEFDTVKDEDIQKPDLTGYEELKKDN